VFLLWHGSCPIDLRSSAGSRNWGKKGNMEKEVFERKEKIPSITMLVYFSGFEIASFIFAA